MTWMNEWNIEEAVDRFRGEPVLGPAARFLHAYMREVNAHSDGWPYWSAPAKAASKLMTVLDANLHAGMGAYPDVPKPTKSDILKTLAPIKAFMTRRGIKAGMTLPPLEL